MDSLSKVISTSFFSSPVILLIPTSAVTEESMAVEIHMIVLIFGKRKKKPCALSLHSEAWDRLSTNHPVLFKCTNTSERVRAQVIAFALLEWKASTDSRCIQQHFIDLF